VPDLKLGKLPDRTPAKITITVTSDLNRALLQYAEVYRSIYGEEEPVAELIPFMLEAFLDSDREFAKARKSGGAATNGGSSVRTASHEPATGPTTIAKGP
jgi:hypothetical protein